MKEASALIRQKALELGFSACGICKAEPVGSQAVYLKEWLDKGCHGQMKYLEKHWEIRNDPRLLLENAQSVIVAALNYYPRQTQTEEAAQFSYYAYGKDYHRVVKDKLHLLFRFISEQLFPVGGRVFCDSAPVLEKYHAVKAGIGWIGKHSQLILPDQGSFFFLGEIVLDKELDYDLPYTEDHCGSCTACIDACPTQAISNTGRLNASRCLSYLSIEYRENLPEELSLPGFQVYGCDLCNKVCPWNRFSQPHSENDFIPSDEFLHLHVRDIMEMQEDSFQTIFGHSVVGRIGLSQLQRNCRKCAGS